MPPLTFQATLARSHPACPRQEICTQPEFPANLRRSFCRNLPVSLRFFLGERKPCVPHLDRQGLVDGKASVDEAQVGIEDAKLVAGP
jgi:hypothetical protein